MTDIPRITIDGETFYVVTLSRYDSCLDNELFYDYEFIWTGFKSAFHPQAQKIKHSAEKYGGIREIIGEILREIPGTCYLKVRYNDAVQSRHAIHISECNGYYSFRFRNPDDAMLFRLRFA